MIHLRKLEESLTQQETRANSDKLNEFIHDEFIEIGYSGRAYKKSDIIIFLLNEDSLDIADTLDTVIRTQEYSFITLSTGTILTNV